MTDLNSLRPVRNNNPCDIEATQPWLGLLSEDQMTPEQRSEPRFAVFRTPSYGFRAALVLVREYGRAHGIKTLRGIVERWAPPNENPTEAYLVAMEHWTGFGAEEELDLESSSVLRKIVRGLATQETGAWSPPWQESQLETALVMLNYQGEGK